MYGALFLHACVSKSGAPLDRTDPVYDPLAAYCVPFRLDKMMPRKQVTAVSGPV